MSNRFPDEEIRGNIIQENHDFSIVKRPFLILPRHPPLAI
jgi:hypothetical protein